MPPAPKRDCSVILFDLNTKCKEKALQTFLKICANNYFALSKDLTRLILVNSAVTENRLNARYGGYEHIYEVYKDEMKYNPKLLLNMIEENSETANADWLEALLVGVKCLSQEFDMGGIVTYQLLFITDLSTPLESYDKDTVDSVIDGIKEIDAFLYIIGPDVEVPFTIKNPDDIKMWMNSLHFEDNQNMSVSKEIITNTNNSLVCDYKMGIHLFFSYRNWGGPQPWQVPLSIGSKIKIPAQTVRILNEGMQIKLTSTSGRFGKIIWIDAEDETVEIDPLHVRKGIMRHEKMVLIEDNKMFQVETTRGFSVLCFTDSINVPEYLMRGEEGCYCVLPNGTPENNEAMTILIDCLAKQNKYVIARRVYNNNGIPKIVALIPKPDHKPKCFYLTALPFGEDIRFNYIEKKTDSAPQIDVVDEVYTFLDSIDTSNENLKNKVPLGVPMMLDANTQKLVDKVTDKFLEKYMRLEELNIDYISDAASGKAFENLKNIWVEREVNEVKKKGDNANDENSDSDLDW